MSAVSVPGAITQIRNFVHLVLITAFTLIAIDHASAMKMEKTFVQGSVKVPVWIFSPDKTDGKIPAVLLVQGSGGVNLKGRSFYAEAFAKMGVATIFFDAFTPRGVKDTVKKQAAVNPFDMADDVRKILLSLKDSPMIDIDRVGIIGFSKGGGVVMNLSLAQFNKNPDVPKFAFYIAMYPPCDSIRYRPKVVDRPLAILIGEKDTYNSPASCKEYADVLLKTNGNKNIRLNVLNGEHAWDVPGPAHVTATGENYSRCRFIEVSPEVWYDSTMRFKIYDHGRTAERKKALKECMTHQVSWGYSKEAAEQSFNIVKEYVAGLKSPKGIVTLEK